MLAQRRAVLLDGSSPKKTLKQGLVSFWPCATANAVDLKDYGPSGQTLTNNGTVTAGTGPGGNLPFAAVFATASSQYLSRADSAALSVGDIPFTFTVWVYLASSIGALDRQIIAKDLDTSREYLLYQSAITGRFDFQVLNGVTTAIGTASSTTFGTPANNTWYFIQVFHDSVKDLVGISVNNGIVDTAATTGVPGDGTAEFQIGARVYPLFPGYWDGRIAGAAFWKRLLTAKELAYLRAAPRSYPF